MNAILPPKQECSQDEAYNFIKRRILNLDFKPNERLRAQDLATQLKLSRTPVREALSRLEQDGLVHRESGWGYIVRAMSYSDVLDFYNVREALEVKAVQEAIRFVDDRMLERMKKTLEKAEKCLVGGKLENIQAHNRKFHCLIAETSGNKLLQQMLLSLDDKVRLLGAISNNHYKARAQEAIGEHYGILDAMRRKNIKEAEAAIRSHIKRGVEVAGMRSRE
jgi:DNA-binding GntR family transcriptional regulator